MSKRYTRKTFPTWTPPLFGWQYRWELNDPRWVLDRDQGLVKSAAIASPPIFLNYDWDPICKAHLWVGKLSSTRIKDVVKAATMDDLVEKMEASAKELHNELGEMLGHE